jgi:hypothetical protein
LLATTFHVPGRVSAGNVSVNSYRNITRNKNHPR